MDTTNTNLTLTLDPYGVSSALLNALGNSVNNVLFGLEIAESVEQLKEPLEQSDEMFLTLRVPGNSASSEQPDSEQPGLEQPDMAAMKENFKLWLLQKGSEDLMKAINLALIEAYYYISLVAKVHTIMKFQDLQAEVQQLRETALKQSLPGLLAKVKPGLTGKLALEEEILSLNKARNCLVHRNGIVSDMDVNDTANNRLRIDYIRLKACYEADGRELEVKKGALIPGGSLVTVKNVKESIVFHRGDRIRFSYQQFNNLALTCIAFGNELVPKLPIPVSNQENTGAS